MIHISKPIDKLSEFEALIKELIEIQEKKDATKKQLLRKISKYPPHIRALVLYEWLMPIKGIR